MSEDAGMDEDDVQIVVRFVIPQGKTELTVSEALSLDMNNRKMLDWDLSGSVRMTSSH